MRVIFALISLLLLGVSCSTRATDPTHFTQDPALLEKGKVFQREWKISNFSEYDKVHLMPVTTAYLKELGWWEKQNLSNYDDSGVWPVMHADRNRPVAKELVKYIDKTFREEFENNPENKMKLVGRHSLDRKTLVVEVALTEMVPVKKWFLGLNWIGDGSLKGGVATIEGQIKSAVTGKVLMSFTDRRVNSATKVSREAGAMYWYSHAKPIIQNWAKMLVVTCNETYPKDK